jgi:hypothetical protein
MTNFNFYNPDFIDSANISRLVENKIQENISLDYKRDLNLESSDERKEFLYDICSFANTEGGIIIYGVEEEKGENSSNSGIPGKIIGIQHNGIDSLILKIEDIIGNSIQPKISNIRIISLEVSTKTVLVIIVPKNIGLPHMVTYKSTNKFYKRRNSGKYLVDIYELNQMFMQNNELQEKANKFVLDRLNLVLNEEFMPNVMTKKSSFIHIIPLSFAQNQVRLTNREDYQYIYDHLDILNSVSGKHHNFEGYIMYSFYPGETKIDSFLQVFRNGVIEYFSVSYINTILPNNDQQSFYIDDFERDTIDLVSKSISYYKKINLFDPLLIFINIFDLLDVRISTSSRYRIPRPIGRQQLKIPPILIKNHDANIAQELKPAFDIIWQSSGVEKSINYNDLGQRLS